MRRVNMRDQDGAIAVITALLVIVLVGFAAIAVDVGALYLERRELQNGADAAALAIAQDCTVGVSTAGCSDPGSRVATARTYADANANDLASSVADTGVTLDLAAQKVTVEATTKDLSSADISRLAHWFAPVLGIDATEVKAKGAAIFGSVSLSGEPHIPITVGRCELEYWTAGGFYYPTNTPDPLTLGDSYPFPPNWYQIAADGTATQKPPFKLEFQSGNPMQPSYCAPGEAGQNYPGGFGGLSTTGDCTVESLVGYADGNEGAALIEHNDCKDYCEQTTGDSSGACNDDALRILGKVVYLPIFESYDTGTKLYELNQPAAFFVTSYNFGPQYNGTLSGHTNCQLSNTAPECLEGYFTTVDIEPGAAVDVGGADTGIYSTQLVLE